ncbi:MAG TPA: hypothetical protein VFQ85_07395 [Mycobacteriales bacterium]|jgi:hypothetical protein|nr:hypothetical protein [Mycobacteriales bacterium]
MTVTADPAVADDRYDDDLDIVANQQAQSHCGCGDPVVLYEGEWFHVYNPALTGTDDHDAHPEGEIVPNPGYDPASDPSRLDDADEPALAPA